MLDDIFAEMLEAGVGSPFAKQVKTDGKGVTRTLLLDAFPAGDLTDVSAWAEAAEEGMSVREQKSDAVEGDKSKSKDGRGRGFAKVTGKYARRIVERVNGVDRPKEKGKRSGKPDAVPEPSANGHAG